jgi:peptidoglycan hydrolase-like protein with peptidoglycan-binding domain
LGSPYYGGYYPYDNYGYNYGYSYPYRYNYGSYTYNNYGYGHGSVVIAVQSRLARMGYYRGLIDGVMGPETSFAISAYERDHGLRVDGAISRQLVRNMGVRY